MAIERSAGLRKRVGHGEVHDDAARSIRDVRGTIRASDNPTETDAGYRGIGPEYFESCSWRGIVNDGC